MTNNTSDKSGGGFFVNALDKTVTLNPMSVTGNTATGGKGGGYVTEGTLAGQLLAGQLTGNTAGQGLDGIGARLNSFPLLTVAPGQQMVEWNQP